MLSIVIIPTPGSPSRADILTLAPFMGIAIPVKPLKILSAVKHIVPGIADFMALNEGCLYFKIKCIKNKAIIIGAFFKIGVIT